jgi:hypothetical protein
MFRALLEGIAFEQRLALEAMEKVLEQPVEVLLTTGGGSRSALWRQIMADVTRKPVVACREVETDEPSHRRRWIMPDGRRAAPSGPDWVWSCPGWGRVDGMGTPTREAR